MRNPAFARLLAEMSSLHESKNSDYAKDGDPYSNFAEAAEVARGFTGIDAVFATLIGVKLARLRELTSTKKAPNHESVADTRKDLAMYAALWASWAERPQSYDEKRAAEWARDLPVVRQERQAERHSNCGRRPVKGQ